MIVVAGSTGVLGFEICRRLRERDRSVRALVRATSAPERVGALRALGCAIAVCDLKDRGSLDAASAGADTVISTVTAITTAKAGDSFAATDGAGTINLIEASVAARARQLIFVSFDTDEIPAAPLIDAKRAAEEHLRRSGLAYTILHSALFMESWLGMRVVDGVPDPDDDRQRIRDPVARRAGERELLIGPHHYCHVVHGIVAHERVVAGHLTRMTIQVAKSGNAPSVRCAVRNFWVVGCTLSRRRRCMSAFSKPASIVPASSASACGGLTSRPSARREISELTFSWARAPVHGSLIC